VVSIATKIFTYKDYQLEYIIIGSGEKKALAFHGFGRTAEDYCALTSLKDKYTIYSFNLLHHGNSKFLTDKQVWSKADLKELFEVFLYQNNIEMVSLFAYSLGGKVVLCLAELLPKKINELFLMAPDGIKINVWYNLVTKFWLTNFIYKHFIKNPKPVHYFARFLKAIRLLDKRIYKFAYHQTNSKHKREMVCKTWMTFRELNPDLAVVAKNINEQKITTHLFFGKYDRIISADIAHRLTDKLNDNYQTHILETGHDLVNEKLDEYFIDKGLV
jgi:pimeloyl-ACP methyl ester carboxylesterase